MMGSNVILDHQQAPVLGLEDVDISSTASTSYCPYAPSPIHDFPPSTPSGHQRTLTGSFLDRIVSSATTTLRHHASQASQHSLPSPTKSLASIVPVRSSVQSGASQPKIRALQSWFNGSSASVRLGTLTRSQSSLDWESESEDEYDSREDDQEGERHKNHMFANIFARNDSPSRSPCDSSRRAEATPTPTKALRQPNAGGKFAWLLSTQRNADVRATGSSVVYHNPDDELLNLNISQSLFPQGPADPLAPSSFHDLLTNAEALLFRYQRSYRQLSASLVDAHSEKSAQEDELDEADTRVHYLKAQLETMAARANEQDAQMNTLMEDLAHERHARQEMEAARSQSVSLARGTAKAKHVMAQGTAPRLRNRTSNSSMSIDSGFESEYETDRANSFLRDSFGSVLTDQYSVLEDESSDTVLRAAQTQVPQQRNICQKVRDGTVDLTQGGWGCTNCEGGAQAAVWGRLAKEREENRILRNQVCKLEEAIEGALNVVDNPWKV